MHQQGRSLRLVTSAVALVMGGLWILVRPTPVLAQAVWSNGSSGAIYYNSGNVGIGTSTPANQLQVYGSGAANVDLAINGAPADRRQ